MNRQTRHELQVEAPELRKFNSTSASRAERLGNRGGEPIALPMPAAEDIRRERWGRKPAASNHGVEQRKAKQAAGVPKRGNNPSGLPKDSLENPRLPGVPAGPGHVDAPPPPPEWVWPRDGEALEVETADGDVTAWQPAEVVAVLQDGWFQARIGHGDQAWSDWFTWQEEGTDWRRPPAAPQPRLWPSDASTVVPEDFVYDDAPTPITAPPPTFASVLAEAGVDDAALAAAEAAVKPPPPKRQAAESPAVCPPAAAPKLPSPQKPARQSSKSWGFAEEVLLCCHKMEWEGGNPLCELPFGHPGPHSQPGGVGKRERKKRVKEDLTG